MNKRIVPFYKHAIGLKEKGDSDVDILNKLKDQGATLAIAIKTLEKLGLDLDSIDELLKKSVWKDHFRSLDDLFFDFIELDDGLVE